MNPKVAGGGMALALLMSLAPPAPALELADVLRAVATANPTLAARRDMVEAARQRVGPAGAWPAPMVELGAINVPTSGRFDADPMTMTMVGVRQSVPVSGGNGLDRASARSAAAAEAASAESAGNEQLADAWQAYADAWAAGELVGLADGHQGELDRMVRAAQARYASGNGGLDDVLRAQAEQARLLADLATYQGERRAAGTRLLALMGRDPAGALDSLAPPPAVSVPAEPGPWLAAAGAASPRVRALQAQVDRYRLAARAERRALWPELELGASYGFRRPIGGVPQDDMWSATLGFALPVFAGSQTLARSAEMGAMARAQESELRAAQLDQAQRLLATHGTARADQRLVALLADTVLATQRRAVAASWSAYGAGSTDLWRVFEATHELYDEEVALVRARQDLARTAATLLALTGRGDLLGLSLPAPPRSGR